MSTYSIKWEDDIHESTCSLVLYYKGDKLTLAEAAEQSLKNGRRLLPIYLRKKFVVHTKFSEKYYSCFFLQTLC